LKVARRKKEEQKGSDGREKSVGSPTKPTRYCSHIPWEINNFRILLRKGARWLVRPNGDEEPLLPLPDGSFRLGEEPSPEHVRFE
jgi:hypothetical protein